MERGEEWMCVFYAMVAGDFLRYYLGGHAVWIYLAVGILGLIYREKNRETSHG
jgi:hypothetical protein